MKPNKSKQKAELFAAMQSLSLRAGVAGKPDFMAAPVSQPDRVLESAVMSANHTYGDVAEMQNVSRRIFRGAIDLPDAPATIEESGLINYNMVLDDSQEAAVKTMLDNHRCALIGAAGTGKTTLLKRVLAHLIYGSELCDGIGIRKLGDRQGPSIALATFTGVASSVIKGTLPSWLHPACKTIHTLLEFAPVSEDSKMFEPKRNAKNKLDHDVIVIDEASMLGLNLWHMLLDACRSDVRIYLMGDLNQLVPIADSPFFPYILADGVDPNGEWKIAELTTIHRQTGTGGGKIIDAAHRVLNGVKPNFEEPTPGQPWAVINVELPANSEQAHSTILKYLSAFSKLKGVGDDGQPESTAIYFPFDDLVLTTGNGYNPEDRGAAIMQAPLNESLSRIFCPEGPEHPVYVIDAGRETRRYAVGDRVMCLANEEHSTQDRVTNGTLGKIIAIEPNALWNGDRLRFGTQSEILAEQLKRVEAIGKRHDSHAEVTDELMASFDSFAETAANMDLDLNEKIEYAKQASHIVTILYKNGATRRYSSAMQIENTQLAYATTTAKAQGSQADFIAIVCHSAAKHQLSREWLYTSITRARKRVVLFSTDLGLRSALAKQQIVGKSLADKIRRYAEIASKGDRLVRLHP